MVFGARNVCAKFIRDFLVNSRKFTLQIFCFSVVVFGLEDGFGGGGVGGEFWLYNLLDRQILQKIFIFTRHCEFSVIHNLSPIISTAVIARIYEINFKIIHEIPLQKFI